MWGWLRSSRPWWGQTPDSRFQQPGQARDRKTYLLNVILILILTQAPRHGRVPTEGRLLNDRDSPQETQLQVQLTVVVSKIIHCNFPFFSGKLHAVPCCIKGRYVIRWKYERYIDVYVICIILSSVGLLSQVREQRRRFDYIVLDFGNGSIKLLIVRISTQDYFVIRETNCCFNIFISLKVFPQDITRDWSLVRSTATTVLEEAGIVSTVRKRVPLKGKHECFINKC